MNHNWYAVITAKILLAKDLSSTQKLLVALISNLSNERGYCFASNNYLGECLNVAPETISRSISDLADKKIIGRIVKVGKDKKVEMRILTVIEDQPLPDKISTPIDEKVNTPIDEKVKENNKEYNNKENSIYITPDENFLLDLPEIKINACIEYLKITKNVNADRAMVDSLWTLFKEKNFTGRKNYKHESDIFTHFLETLKFEKINGRKSINHSTKTAGAYELLDRIKTAAGRKTDS